MWMCVHTWMSHRFREWCASIHCIHTVERYAAASSHIFLIQKFRAHNGFLSIFFFFFFSSVKHFMKWYHITYLRRKYILPSLCVYHSKKLSKMGDWLTREPRKMCTQFIWAYVLSWFLRMNSFHSLYFPVTNSTGDNEVHFFVCLMFTDFNLLIFVTKPILFRIKSQFLNGIEWTEQINSMISYIYPTQNFNWVYCLTNKIDCIHRKDV